MGTYKKVLKQYVSFALAIILYLSAIPINVQAADTSIGGINGGETSGVVNISQDARAWYNNEQGYRFYIINENFERISPVYDFYFTTPTISMCPRS